MPSEPKPRPCVGCGYCCLKARCAVSFYVEGKRYQDPFQAIGEPQRCPWLYREEGGKYRCKVAGLYRRALAIGDGCCSPLNSRRREMIEHGDVP